MSRLYIANCTQQYQVLNYRLVENRNAMTQPVDMGRQVQIARADLTDVQVESVIEQMRKYGLLMTDEIGKKHQTQIPFVASVGHPVGADLIRRVIDHNKGIMQIDGEKLRRHAAIAVNQKMAETTPNAAETLEMTIQEEKPQEGDNALNHTYGFHDSGDATSPDRPRRQRRAA